MINYKLFFSLSFIVISCAKSKFDSQSPSAKKNIEIKAPVISENSETIIKQTPTTTETKVITIQNPVVSPNTVEITQTPISPPNPIVEVPPIGTKRIEEFVQPKMGDLREETSNSPVSTPLDIVLVIDNSGSMAQEQANLASKLANLLISIKDSDWQISIITTDSKLRGIIKKTEGDIDNRFSNAVRAGTKGKDTEIGVKAAVDALNFMNGSWLRPNSTIAVLIVSDEDNCSDGKYCGGAAYQNSYYLSDKLKSLRTYGKNARVYGIFYKPNTICETASFVANIYNSLVVESNGVSGSICDTDFSSTLNTISKDISVIVDKLYKLKETADASTIQVFVNNIEQKSNWTFVDNSVKFSSDLSAGSIVKIKYNLASDSKKTNYILKYKPDKYYTKVFINNVEHLSSEYTINDSVPYSINFKNPVAPESKIKIEYFGE